MKTFAELTMEVIRKDYQHRKDNNPSRYTGEKMAKKMKISRVQFANALTDPKDPTISFICNYAVAVGLKPGELLNQLAQYIDDDMEEKLIEQSNDRTIQRKSPIRKHNKPDVPTGSQIITT